MQQLKLSQVQLLYYELYGAATQVQRLSKGFLNQKALFSLKFKIQDRVGKKCQDAISMIDKERKILALSFGATEDANGGFSFATVDRIENNVKITEFIDKIKIDEFTKALTDFLDKEENKIDFEVTKINLSLFVDENNKPLCLEENYPVLMQYFITDDSI